ncbi:MAG: hypothetical protein ACREUQ_10160, partial [Burkholderiales bacterium]
GYTYGPTELKANPFLDAATTATLAEQTGVEIVTRQGAWMQVKTTEDKLQGWVRMLSVRLGDPARAPSGGNILSALGFGDRPRPQTTATVTTGVRGFSEDDLKRAQPNPAEADKMDSFAASAVQAEQLARSGELESRAVEYFGEDGKPVETKK